MKSLWSTLLKRTGSFFLVCGTVWIVILICLWFYQYVGVLSRTPTSLHIHIPASSTFKDLDSGTIVSELTVVTGCFSLKHIKDKNHHGINYKMLDELSTLNSSIVLFTDDTDIEMYFADMRRRSENRFYTTDILLLVTKRSNSDQVRINHEEGKPTPYIPQTSEEFYTYFKHWKYELLEWVIADKMIETKYLTWFDPTVYLDPEYDLQNFSQVPMAIKDEHIAFKQIGSFNPDLNVREVIQKNKVWVSGNLFFGKPKHIWILVMDYKKQLKELMSTYGLISSDEQVLYTMQLKDSKNKPRVLFQTYT